MVSKAMIACIRQTVHCLKEKKLFSIYSGRPSRSIEIILLNNPDLGTAWCACGRFCQKQKKHKQKHAGTRQNLCTLQHTQHTRLLDRGLCNKVQHEDVSVKVLQLVKYIKCKEDAG